MTPDPRSHVNRFMLASAMLLAVVSMMLALVGIYRPGYADSEKPDLILQAVLQTTPTPIPTPIAAACGVRIAQSLTLATDTASIDLWNEGASVTVEAVTLVWPADNGALVEVRLGGRELWSGWKEGGSVTIFPNLAEILPSIKAGEQISLALRFSGGAVEGRYVVLVHLGKSCYALFDSASDVARAESCFATFDRFYVDEQQAVLVVRNTTAEGLTLDRLMIFWPQGQAALRGVQFGDSGNLISERAATSPAEVVLPTESAITLRPEQSIPLTLTFDGMAPLVGYTILLQADGCQSVFSNAEPPSECPVRQDGRFVVVGRTAGLILQNVGEEDELVEELWITFPETNGALVDVTLNNASIVDQSRGGFPKTSSPATMAAGVDLLPEVRLPSNRRSTLGFVFEQAASPEHYTVEVDLANGCRVLSSTRVNAPVPCQVQVNGDAPVRTEANRVWLAIRNSGTVEAELQAVTVDWDDQHNGALREVAVAGTVFWQGERTGGTATVIHNTGSIVPVIEPGQVTELQLTFERDAVDHPYVIRMDFAEGCWLSYATQRELAAPTPVEFPGVIYRLPEDLFDGVWQIEVSTDEVLNVRVTPQTLIEPRELTPLEGDYVRVRALSDDGGEYLATYIRVFPRRPKLVQFSGVIEEVSPGASPEYIIVQGVRVVITTETKVRGQLEVGWLADVAGYERADGSVLARSISTTEPTVPPVYFQGVVEGWRSLNDVEALWIVSGLWVIVHQIETIHHGIEPGVPPEIGTEVQVAGDLVSAGTVRAREIWYGPGEDIVEFSGFIRDLPDDPQYQGIWLIEDSAVGTCDPLQDPTAEACKSVLVTDSTFLDMSEAIPVVDAPVQVRARRNLNGSLEALWIKILIED